MFPHMPFPSSLITKLENFWNSNDACELSYFVRWSCLACFDAGHLGKQESNKSNKMPGLGKTREIFDANLTFSWQFPGNLGKIEALKPYQTPLQFHQWYHHPMIVAASHFTSSFLSPHMWKHWHLNTTFLCWKAYSMAIVIENFKHRKMSETIPLQQGILIIIPFTCPI